MALIPTSTLLHPIRLTVDAVAEDLADFGVDDSGVANEVTKCPELAAMPPVRVALEKLGAAQREVCVAATIEIRDRIAAWHVRNAVSRMLDALDSILMLAGVRDEHARFLDFANDAPLREEWEAMWRAYVASSRAWEHLPKNGGA